MSIQYPHCVYTLYIQPLANFSTLPSHRYPDTRITSSSPTAAPLYTVPQPDYSHLPAPPHCAAVLAPGTQTSCPARRRSAATALAAAASEAAYTVAVHNLGLQPAGYIRCSRPAGYIRCCHPAGCMAGWRRPEASRPSTVGHRLGDPLPRRRTEALLGRRLSCSCGGGEGKRRGGR